MALDDLTKNPYPFETIVSVLTETHIQKNSVRLLLCDSIQRSSFELIPPRQRPLGTNDLCAPSVHLEPSPHTLHEGRLPFVVNDEYLALLLDFGHFDYHLQGWHLSERLSPVCSSAMNRHVNLECRQGDRSLRDPLMSLSQKSAIVLACTL